MMDRVGGLALAPLSQGQGYAGFIDRMNRRLLPYIGPPPLGPYNEEAAPSRPAACPLGAAPMPRHEIDRSGEGTQLYCP